MFDERRMSIINLLVLRQVPQITQAELRDYWLKRNHGGVRWKKIKEQRRICFVFR